LSTTVLQGRVAIWVNDGGIFNDYFIANLLPRLRPRPRGQERNFLGYLIFIYIGNQITDIYAIRYHTSTVHGLLGICHMRTTSCHKSFVVLAVWCDIHQSA